ncbi:MAG: hypothetical protein ACRDQ1_19770 [Sciscionella sp.]
MTGHVFVDESKRRGYLLAAATVSPADLDPLRKMVRGLVLPGQRRLHMKDERDSRKRSIATAISLSGIQATIYDAGVRYRNESDRRAACLAALVSDLAQRDVRLLVLEQDDTQVNSDRKLLYRAIRGAGRPNLRYEHLRATEEQLLALPDAIAWCWAKGGYWRRRIEPVVAQVRQV